MGNQATKDEEPSLLSPEESAFVLKAFKNLSGNSEQVSADVLEKAWETLADKELVTYIVGCCTESGRVVTIKAFEQHYYVAVWGSLDEKSNFINCNIFHNSPGVEGGITPERLQKFVAAVVRSYFVMLDNNKTKQYDSWLAAGLNESCNHRDINNYAEFLLKDLADVQPVSLDELENWLHRNPLWSSMWKEVVMFLYGHKSSVSSEFQLNTLPMCELPPNCSQVTSMLSAGKIMFLNDQLPTEKRCKWRLLFNSDIHGESFATFLGKLTHRGPTLLIVQDDSDHIFGGYAPESWALGPKFVGNDTALLFTLQPNMQSFTPSGYNDHYQYLNTHQQTMPNGLGMGGQFDYWGLWLDCDYGNGSTSESCTTFKNYTQMSANKKFKVRNLEVWGVGEEPKEEEDEKEPRGSVLDENLDDKAMLEMAGREIYSEGLRDPDLDL